MSDTKTESPFSISGLSPELVKEIAPLAMAMCTTWKETAIWDRAVELSLTNGKSAEDSVTAANVILDARKVRFPAPPPIAFKVSASGGSEVDSSP